MSKKYIQLSKLTLKSVERRKLRSFLTILSVIIGIASIVALILLSDGLLNTVEHQFSKMGGRAIIVISGNFMGNPFQSDKISKENIMTLREVQNLEKIPEVENVYPINYLNGFVSYKNQTEFAYFAILPLEKYSDFIEYSDLELERGKIFNKEGNDVVISHYIAHKMFDREIKIGNKIKINDVDFRVIGIFKDRGSGGGSMDSPIYFTRRTVEDLFKIDNAVNYSVLETRKDTDNRETVKKINRELRRTKKEEAYTIISAEDVLELITRVLTLIKIVLATIAGISIVVGSLGVINSVYTSVLERTKEIGILKSIGAKMSDILYIFVLESVLLSLIGGFIGFVIGASIAYGVAWYVNSLGYPMFTIMITKGIIIFSFFLSLGVGLVSGLFPARAAAKLNPVNALREQMS